MDESDNQNTHAVRKQVLAELVKGREVVTQLQTLIDKPVGDREGVDVEDLALQIIRSFSNSLSVISSCADLASSAPISAACSGEEEKKPSVKNRRGCYKRRRTSDSCVIISTVEDDDGYAWRKYGQKNILNFEFPRCYYRCTHKQEGCKAIKQVQKIKDDPISYQTTYLNHHTCKHTPRLPLSHTAGDDHRRDPHLLSFQSSEIPYDRSTNPTMILTVDQTVPPSLKEEDMQSDDQSSDAKPSPLQDAWREIFGYSHIWEEARTSPGSTGFDDGLGMEIIGKFLDIESFHFDDQIYM